MLDKHVADYYFSVSTVRIDSDSASTANKGGKCAVVVLREPSRRDQEQNLNGIRAVGSRWGACARESRTQALPSSCLLLSRSWQVLWTVGWAGLKRSNSVASAWLDAATPKMNGDALPAFLPRPMCGCAKRGFECQRTFSSIEWRTAGMSFRGNCRGGDEKESSFSPECGKSERATFAGPRALTLPKR